MVNLPENWKPVAFKEWQVVCDALESGEQSLILRKGGISEGKRGFQWIHDRFFLFPTAYHEQADQVHPDAAGKKRRFQGEDSDSGKNGTIEFRLLAETTETGRLTDWDEIRALAGQHIWTEETIRDRYEWGDEPGVSFARVRIWRLRDPWILSDRKSFGGCRSWIGLPAEECENPPLEERLAAAELVDPAGVSA